MNNISSKLAHIWWVVVLLGFNFILVIGMNSNSNESTENRTLAQFPDFSWDMKMVSYPDRMEKFVADNFYLRSEINELYSKLLLRVFRVSLVDKVIVGQDSWLYYSEKNMIYDLAKTRQFTPSRLNEWAGVLESRSNWLSERQVKHLVVIVPNKQSIHPEHLPVFVRRGEGMSRYDELKQYLGQQTEVELVDVHTPMQALAKNQQLYYKQDTHWNFWGAFTAQKQVLEAVAKYYPDVQPLKASDTREHYWEKPEQDLSMLLAISDGISGDGNTHTLATAAAELVQTIDDDTFVYESGKDNLPVIVVYGDSFMKHILVELLAERASRLVFFNSPLGTVDENMLEIWQPDIVIDELVERHLMDDSKQLEMMR